MNFDLTELFTNQLNTVLEKHGLNNKDILWVGSKNGAFYCEWTEFYKRLRYLSICSIYFDYSSVDADASQGLVIVGKDWWLELHNSSKSREYAADYFWQFYKQPTVQVSSKKFKYLPGSLKVGFCNTEPVEILVKEYTNSNELDKILNALDKEEYLREDFDFEDYDITPEEIEQLKKDEQANNH